ncbi:MAG: hypothetical protein PVI09_08175 [Anaerolineae bacterium]|jgi:hypothetical protein
MMKVQDVLPIVLSIALIILVAILERQSRLIAAVTAVMPLGATLAYWIVYSANEGEPATMEPFSRGLVLGLMPTLAFVIVVWLATRAGLKLVPVLIAGYAVWGVGVALLLVLRRTLGF